MIKVAWFDVNPKLHLNKKVSDFTPEDWTIVYTRDPWINNRKLFPEFTDLEYKEHVSDREEEQFNLYEARTEAEDLIDYGLGPTAMTLWNDDKWLIEEWDMEEMGWDLTWDGDDDEDDIDDDEDFDDLEQWIEDDDDDDEGYASDEEEEDEEDREEEDDLNDWEDVYDGPFIYDRLVPSDWISNIFNDIIPILEGYQANPEFGVYWPQHLDVYPSYVKDYDPTNDRVGKRSLAKELPILGLEHWAHVLTDPELTTVLGEATPLSKILRARQLRNADKDLLKQGFMSDWDREKFLEELDDDELREAKEAFRKEELINKLRRQGTLFQEIDEQKLSEKKQESRTLGENDDISATKTKMEARRDQYFKDMEKRKKIHSKALPKEAQKVREEQQKLLRYDKHEQIIEEGSLEHQQIFFDGQKMVKPILGETSNSKKYFEWKTEVSLRPLFADIPKPHKWAEDDEYEEIQTELENRIIYFYIDWIELQAYAWIAKFRDDYAGLLSAPLIIFFIFIAIIEYLVVNPLLWVMEFSLNNVLSRIKNITWNEYHQLLKLKLNSIYFSTAVKFFVNKLLHFSMFVIAYIRYALWRYIGLRLVLFVEDVVLLPAWFLYENFWEMWEVHLETWTDCLIYLKSMEFHPAEKIWIWKPHDDFSYPWEQIIQEAINFKDPTRTLRLRLKEFGMRVIRLWIIDFWIPFVLIWSMLFWTTIIGWMDFITYGAWDLLTVTEMTNLRMSQDFKNRTKATPPISEYFQDTDDRSITAYCSARRGDGMKHVKWRMFIHTLMFGAYGAGQQIDYGSTPLKEDPTDDYYLGPYKRGNQLCIHEFWLPPDYYDETVITGWDVYYGKHLNSEFKMEGVLPEFLTEYDVPLQRRHITSLTIGDPNADLSYTEIKKDFLNKIYFDKHLAEFIDVWKWAKFYRNLYTLWYDVEPTNLPTIDELFKDHNSRTIKIELSTDSDETRIISEHANRAYERLKFGMFAYDFISLEKKRELFHRKQLCWLNMSIWFQRYAELLNQYGDAFYKGKKNRSKIITQHMWASFVQFGQYKLGYYDEKNFDILKNNGKTLSVNFYPNEAMLGINLALPFKEITAGGDILLQKASNLIENKSKKVDNSLMEIYNKINERSQYITNAYQNKMERIEKLRKVKLLDEIKYHGYMFQRDYYEDLQKKRISNLNPTLVNLYNLNKHCKNHLSEVINDFKQRLWVSWFLYQYQHQMFKNSNSNFFMWNKIPDINHKIAMDFVILNSARKQEGKDFWRIINIDFCQHLNNVQLYSSSQQYWIWLFHAEQRLPIEFLQDQLYFLEYLIPYSITVEIYLLQHLDILETKRGKWRPLFQQRWFQVWWDKMLYKAITESLSWLPEQGEKKVFEVNSGVLEHNYDYFIKKLSLREQKYGLAEMYKNRDRIRYRFAMMWKDPFWNAKQTQREDNAYDLVFDLMWNEVDSVMRTRIINSVQLWQEDQTERRIEHNDLVLEINKLEKKWIDIQYSEGWI